MNSTNSVTVKIEPSLHEEGCLKMRTEFLFFIYRKILWP